MTVLVLFLSLTYCECERWGRGDDPFGIPSKLYRSQRRLDCLSNDEGSIQITDSSIEMLGSIMPAIDFELKNIVIIGAKRVVKLSTRDVLVIFHENDIEERRWSTRSVSVRGSSMLLTIKLHRGD